VSRGPKNPYKKPDAFTQAAKAKGFPARSVFKLEEIDRRARLFRHGQRVLDLGAAPGSWSKYAAERVGGKGRVLAIDRQEIREALGPNVTVVKGDALSIANEALAAHAPYDVVVSDMAPSTTGDRSADQAKSFELFARAVEIAEALGAPGGAFVGKIFMGGEFEEARRLLREAYAEVRVIRPEATRAVSYEVFLVGQGKKAPSG
jgi:23S rRNA (uridine2552-2'-O)-methyltransferase